MKNRRRRRKSRGRWWDWHVPVVGFLGLLLWSTTRRRRKSTFEVSGEGDLQSMIPTFVGLTEGAVDPGNHVEVLQNGAFFDALLRDIAAAESSVHIESFIWWTGEVCDELAAALIDASARGIEVRLMVDYSGSTKMDRRLASSMKDAGCDVRRFRPPRLNDVGRMNLRTHRKIVVIDGRTGYVGGHGIAAEWSGNAQDRNHWRDTAVRIRGPAVTTLQGVFCENWIEETGEIPTGATYFPKLEPDGPTDAHVAYASPRGSISGVQLLYYLAINAARRELIIQNPFFLPDRDAIEALKRAVRRGVDVQIMLPAASAVSGSQAFVEHASHRHFADLLGAGVRILEYQRSLLHQKIMIVDGLWCCVGSTNFDDRSFDLNDEVTVGFIDADLAMKLRRAFEEDRKLSVEVDLEKWRGRSRLHQAFDWLAFLARREL